MQRTDRVLLVTGDRATAASLRASLEAHGPQVRIAYEGLTALAALKADRFDLVVLDTAIRGISGLDLLAAVRSMSGQSSTPVMALIDPGDKSQRLRLFELGVDEVAVKPVSPLEFLTRTRRLLAQKPEAVPPQRGRVTVFVGVAGGVGTTTICANVAEMLGSRRSTIALDFAWPLGGMSHLLALPMEPGLEAIEASPEPTTAFLSHLTGGPPRLNFRLLAGLGSLAQSNGLVFPVAEVIRGARDTFAHVLVDLGGAGAPFAADAIAEADTVVVVLGLERPHFTLGRLKLDWIDRSASADSRRIIVANRTQPSPMAHRDAQRTLEQDIFLTLPYEADRISECLNQGRLLISQYPSSSAAITIAELATVLDREPVTLGAKQLTRGLP